MKIDEHQASDVVFKKVSYAGFVNRGKIGIGIKTSPMIHVSSTDTKLAIPLALLLAVPPKLSIHTVKASFNKITTMKTQPNNCIKETIESYCGKIDDYLSWNKSLAKENIIQEIQSRLKNTDIDSDKNQNLLHAFSLNNPTPSYDGALIKVEYQIEVQIIIEGFLSNNPSHTITFTIESESESESETFIASYVETSAPLVLALSETIYASAVDVNPTAIAMPVTIR